MPRWPPGADFETLDQDIDMKAAVIAGLLMGASTLALPVAGWAQGVAAAVVEGRAPGGRLAAGELEVRAKVIELDVKNRIAALEGPKGKIVLMDVLGSIHQGPQAVEDLRKVMAEVLTAFRVGRSSWLAALIGGKRVEKILFAATRADHLHHEQHPALTGITEALVADAKRRAEGRAGEQAEGHRPRA